MTFEELGLGDEILKAVVESGYTTPTPIQEKAIPTLLMGRDVLGCAQTGTGKTASFTLPMIEILAATRAKARMPRSLILAPTRELAAQVAESFDRYGKYHKLNKALLIGGSSLSEQEGILDRGVHVLIATPGRLLDLFERGKILLSDVKILVIDESDRMLDMGFIPDVERIVSLLPKIRQTLMFSATMPREIRRLAEQFLMNPKEISVDPPASAAETVSQTLVKVAGSNKEKRQVMRELIARDEVKSALIFCNRKKDVDILFKSFKRHGYNTAAMHGDLAQPVRMETLALFKDGKVDLLVCSDVAARGLDIPVVSHVFNFDVPLSSDDYVHRIGRTGRAGRSGKAYTLALPEESKLLASVMTLAGDRMEILTLDGIESWDGAGTGYDRNERGRGRGGRKPRDSGRERTSSRPARKKAPEIVEERQASPPAPEPRAELSPSAPQAKSAPERDEPERHEEAPAPARRSRPARDDGNARATSDRSKTSKTAAKSSRKPSRPKDDEGDKAETVPSFGDHMPAFMRRDVA